MIYGISKVAYGSDRSKITHVIIHEIVNNRIGSPVQMTRHAVIDLIQYGNNCWAILQNSTGNWDWGAQVHVVTTYHGKFIRTDRNSESRDNLGNLPTFVPRITTYSY